MYIDVHEKISVYVNRKKMHNLKVENYVLFGRQN